MGKSQSKKKYTVFEDTSVMIKMNHTCGWCIVDIDSPKKEYVLNGSFGTKRLVFTKQSYQKALDRKRASEYFGRLERSVLVGLFPIKALIATEALLCVLVTQWSLDLAKSRANHYLWYSVLQEAAMGKKGDGMIASYLLFERRAQTNFPIRLLFWITKGMSVDMAKKLAHAEFISDLLDVHEMVTVINANQDELVDRCTFEVRNFTRLDNPVQDDPEEISVLVEDPVLAAMCNKDITADMILESDSFRYVEPTDVDPDVDPDVDVNPEVDPDVETKVSTSDDPGLDKWNKSLDIVPCMRTDSEKFVQCLIQFVNTPENDGALVRSKGSRHMTWNQVIKQHHVS